MIHYDYFTLQNGLRVYVITDTRLPICTLNLMYDVGSKDEDSQKTGFAHLFEHLMFGGSVNIPEFDKPLHAAGGVSNAFTSPDVTNYYITIPSANLETAFWLESDRMLSLAFSPESLEVQRKVVVEEFKQRYLNQPYGDLWLKFRDLAYTEHSYNWATIGKEVSHIENATLDDVKSFFSKHYVPANACLVLAGDITLSKAQELCAKWFEPIPFKAKPQRNLPKESELKAPKQATHYSKVPHDVLLKAFHISSLKDMSHKHIDLWASSVGGGTSSRIYRSLVQEKALFTQFSAFTFSSFEPDMLIFAGHINHKKTSIEDADAALEEFIYSSSPLESRELEKIKKQLATNEAFSLDSISTRALQLAYAHTIGDHKLVNSSITQIMQTSLEDCEAAAKAFVKPERSITMYYKAE
ncbi:MAG: insulinase family protein [Cytophagales bacterium]|nr:MAG: insulinase family protein [Cytophagales bacterium]